MSLIDYDMHLTARPDCKGVIGRKKKVLIEKLTHETVPHKSEYIYNKKHLKFYRRERTNKPISLVFQDRKSVV